MNSQAALALVSVILSVLLAALTGSIGFVIKNQLSANKEFRKHLSDIDTNLQVLNAGATVGAQALVRDLRGKVDEIQERQDDLIERHQNLATAEAILADRVNGHIRTPHTHAHPPPQIGLA